MEATAARDAAGGAEGLMPLHPLLALRRDEILRVAAKHGASNVRIFGSFARGDADSSSDVDFLVDLGPDRSLLDLGGLVMDLRDLLGRDVDVVTAGGLDARMRARILAESISL